MLFHRFLRGINKVHYFIILSFPIHAFVPSPIDLTLIGLAESNTGLGSIGVGIIDVLKDDIKINYYSHIGRIFIYDNIPSNIVEILQNTDKTPGNVALLYFPIYNVEECNRVNSVKSYVRLAYSMLESTKIPEMWVNNFNKNFDAVIIPDEWLKDVYLTCGVTVPIFVLPHGIYLEDFLNEPIRATHAKPFRFGSCATFCDRKNQHLLIDAFQAEFAGDHNVELVLHGDGGGKYLEETLRKVKASSVPSIKISNHNTLTRKEYIEFMKSIDCYVLLSKGEGYSITPRQELALGTPTILSNNTGHITICNSGYVFGVPSNIRNKAEYPSSYNLGDCGDNFNCNIAAVRKELRKVYSNYAEHKKIAVEGREWVKQYTWENMKNKFLMLVKPKEVILGNENIIGEDFLMTNSRELYNKYCNIASMGHEV